LRARTPRRARGFTLIEILISLGLAGLVVAAALQMHAVFNGQANRQQAINEVQQGLRLSMQIVERYIRSGSSGMVGGKMIMNTAGAPITLYGVQYRNSNTFPWPAAPDSTDLDPDTDPDQLKVIATEGTGYLAKLDAANVTTAVGPISQFLAHDLFLVTNVLPIASCLREVTATPGATTIPHASAGTNYAGINPAVDACMTATIYPTPIRRFVHETVFHVFPAVGSDPPKLAMRYANIGDVTATPPWSLISENIEDMQIALLMLDGTVCAYRDDPAVCDPSLVRAIRVTLVGRTSQKMPGAPPSNTGGYEDMPVTAVTDGYLRRAMTSEVVLRN